MYCRVRGCTWSAIAVLKAEISTLAVWQSTKIDTSIIFRVSSAVAQFASSLVKRRYAGHPDLPFWLITASYGLREAQALTEWCDETLAQCEKMKKARTLQEVKPTRERGA